LGAARIHEPAEAPMAGRQVDGWRIVPALVVIPLFYLLVRYLPSTVFFALVAVSAILALLEFYRLHFREERASLSIFLGVGSLGLLLASLQWPGLISERTVFLVTVIAVLSSRLWSQRSLRQSLIDSAVVVFGVLYVGLTLGCLLLTRSFEGGEFLIFFVFLVTWAGDTGAYYVGMSLGRTPLAPVISPNKTVEGLIGGLILATLAALLARVWFLPTFTVADCLAAGVLLTAAGVLGDLTESALKRGAGVKDSGSLIPAHGGMLDRLDSLLFTAPAFYYYVTLVKQ
jgi:phosphatidate cytidylyltransferase